MVTFTGGILNEKLLFLCGELEASHLYQAKTGVTLEWILAELHILGLMSWSNYVDFILNSRSLRYDLNQAITFFETPRYFIFFIKIWRLMVSNAFCKSIKIILVKRLFSNPVVILSVRCPRQVLKSVENFAFTQELLCLVINNPFNNF